MTREELRTAKTATGKVNGSVWLGEPVEYWFMEHVQARLLYGNPIKNNKCAWEVHLQARGDPKRLHRWWWPQLDATNRPPEVEGNTDVTYRKRRLFSIDDRDWDTLIPRYDVPLEPGLP
jgi:hypothetical protein